MKNKLLLISERPEDVGFFSALAKSMGLDFIVLKNTPALLEGLVSREQFSLVVCDIDHAASQKRDSADSFFRIDQLLSAFPKKIRVVTLSDTPVSGYSKFFSTDSDSILPYFPNNIVRSYNGPAAKLYARVLGMPPAFKPCGLTPFFEKGAKISTVPVQESGHRKPVVGAVQSFLQKNGTDPRLAAKVAQAVDELLMNAIFGAYRDRNESATRRFMARDAKFALPGDQVALEMASNGDYVGISVTDRFGTLTGGELLKYLSQDFQSKEYALKRHTVGAGLGLYNTLLSGLSLFLVREPKKRTDAILFFQKLESYKQFRKSFQFFGFFESYSPSDK